MAEQKRLGMKERVAQEMAKLVERELSDDCPEEGMSRFLFDYDVMLVSSRFEDGVWKIVAQRENDRFELCLKPIGWSKLK